ncbi:MAG: hypothetical protein ABIL68_07050 [bacterium]
MDECIDRQLLELFLLGGIQSDAEIHRIERHIGECAECLRYLNKLQAFYETTESIPHETVDRLTARILERIERASKVRSITLTPLPHPKRTESQYLLAAESESCSRYVNVESYANAKEDVVARLIRDNKSQEMTLYLIGRDQDRLKDCILEVQDVDKPLIPDAEGKIDLMDIPKEMLENKPLRLKSPLAVFDLEPVSDFKENILVKGEFLVENKEYDRIQIEVEEPEKKATYKIHILKLHDMPSVQKVDIVVSQKSMKPLVSKAYKGIAVFENCDPEKIMNIRIY